MSAGSGRRHLTGRKPGPLFTTCTGNYVTRFNFVRKDWKPLLEKAEVPYRKFHTHASRLLAAGVTPRKEVTKRIGDRIETLMWVHAH